MHITVKLRAVKIGVDIMKKIICMLSALTLFTAAFSGCGNDKPEKKAPTLDDGEGGFVIAETEPVTTLPKIKQDSVIAEDKTEANGSDETSAKNTTDAADSDTSKSSDVDDVSDENGGSSDDVSDIGTVSDSEREPSSAAQTSTVPEEVYYLEGIVYKVTSKDKKGGSVLIKDPDLGWVDASFGSTADLKNVKVGDRVLVTHNGEIGGTAPSVTTKTYSIEVTEKAPEECTLQRFECKNLDYNLSFSMLVPNSWSSINIDYPTEGDFTDWGVRFTPNGETKGLDISWHSSFAILEPYDITPSTVNGKAADVYSKNGNWRFYVYDNDYIAANTFYNTSEYDEYTDDIEFMLETLEFEPLSFIG